MLETWEWTRAVGQIRFDTVSSFQAVVGEGRLDANDVRSVGSKASSLQRWSAERVAEQ